MSAAGHSLGRPVAVAGAGVAALLSLVAGLPVIALLGFAGSGGAGAVRPADAGALDGWMAEQVPASPLVGLGVVFVREGERNGIDPRALVAIAMHESVLGTAGSGAGIHNAFGWGPAIPFASWEANIATVARAGAGVCRSRSGHPRRDPASLGAGRRRERPDRVELRVDRRGAALLRRPRRGPERVDRVRARCVGGRPSGAVSGRPVGRDAAPLSRRSLRSAACR